MNVRNNYPVWPNYAVVKIALTILLFSLYFVPEVLGSHSENATGQDKFVITRSEFYRRSQFDAGEIRIFLKNADKGPMSISQCKLTRLLIGTDGKQHEVGKQISYLYSKLSPPVLMPGKKGELLIKLLEAPPNNSELKCTVYDNTGRVSETPILIEQAPVWISYVGYSEDLSKVYVYVQNNTQTPLSVRLLEAAGISVGNNYRSINDNLPPGDKTCLVFKMSTPLIFGEHVNITVSAESGDQKWQTHRIVRGVNKFPLLFENGSGDPKLGLDSERFFITFVSPATEVACIQNVSCPAHAHGTHENAAKKFLDNRSSIFLQNPYLLTQMWICRSGKPRAWYKFGPLPDAAVMNPILLALSTYKSDTKASERFSPFFWLATAAKKATAPNRYLACIPLNPEDTVFLQSSHTPDEIKFLVYCAVASGAKGILYRERPSSDQLSRDGFVRLNNELQQLKPLLMMAEPVNWVSTANNDYVAKSLLCGDKAILVIIFDRRYFGEKKGDKLRTPAFEKSLKLVKIKVKVPKEFLVSKVESMYNPLSEKLWNCRANQLEFTADMIDSVQVYKLILTRGISQSSLGGIAERCQNEDTD